MNNLSSRRASDSDIQQIIDSTEKGTMMFLQVDVYYLIAKELLALREAGKEPVAYMWDSERKDIDAPGYYRPEHLVFAENSVKKWGGRVVPLYAAPKLPAVPDGWVMVPRKITLEMECALSRADSYEIGWQWAIAAAPKPDPTVKK